MAAEFQDTVAIADQEFLVIPDTVVLASADIQDTVVLEHQDTVVIAGLVIPVTPDIAVTMYQAIQVTVVAGYRDTVVIAALEYQDIVAQVIQVIAVIAVRVAKARLDTLVTVDCQAIPDIADQVFQVIPDTAVQNLHGKEHGIAAQLITKEIALIIMVRDMFVSWKLPINHPTQKQIIGIHSLKGA